MLARHFFRASPGFKEKVNGIRRDAGGPGKKYAALAERAAFPANRKTCSLAPFPRFQSFEHRPRRRDNLLH
jgi:hypothetical protein